MPVTIYRDGYGVPHVVADSGAAVMFGAGRALAQDRLAAMELSRRVASGRRAELLGASAIEGDKVARSRQLPETELMRMYRALDPEHQQMLQAFVDGINHTVDAVNADPDRLTPLEFRRWGIKPTRWSLIDYLAYIASVPLGRETYEIRNLEFLRAMTARHGAERAWQIFNDVVPIADPDSPLAIPPGDDRAPARAVPVPVRAAAQIAASSATAAAPRLAQARMPHSEIPREASRCMVIGQQRSASGRPMLLQATADGPEIHLQGGGFDTAGFGFNGWGVPFMGRGPRHGWLLVSGSAEASTVFAERLHPRDPTRYWFNGGWQRMERRLESIAVKGAAPVSHMVEWTVHGPVIARDPERKTAYSHQMALRGKELDTWVGILEMGRARSLDEFRSKGVDRVGWNVGACYAGEDGQIAYFEAGRLPIKAAGSDPRLPTLGTGTQEWQGFLTPAEKPHTINPRQAYIVAWNSKATTWSPEGNSARVGAAFRTWLGNRLAASGQGLTLLDLRDFNGRIFNALGAVDRNQTSPDFFAPYLREAMAATNDADARQAATLMLGFDGLYRDTDFDQRYDDPGLTLFRTWLATAPRLLFEDDIGNWWTSIDDDRYLTYQTSLLLRALQGPAAGAPLAFDYRGGQSRADFMIASIKATIAELAPRFAGTPMAQWRLPIFWRYFDAASQRPDRPAYPGTTAGQRLWATQKLGPAMVPHHGGEAWVGLMEINPAHRALYSVVEVGGQNQFIAPDGSGNPHLTDQLYLHASNQLKKVPLDPAEVKATARSSETLRYRPAP